MKKIALVVALVLLFPMGLNAVQLQQLEGPGTEPVRQSGSLTLDGNPNPPAETFSTSGTFESLSAATCSFTITCNDDGTVDFSTDDCTIEQTLKVAKAALDICAA